MSNNEFSREELIELITDKNKLIDQLFQRMENGRNYLMQIEPDKIKVEDCFIAFGYNESGNESV